MSEEPKNVRMDLILDPNVRLSTLIQLADDPDYQVRSMVAYHPNTPPEILRKLMNDEYASVVEAVAKNPNTPIDILEILANRKGTWECGVRYLAMYNLVGRPDVSTKVLRKIMQYGFGELRRLAEKALQERGL